MEHHDDTGFFEVRKQKKIKKQIHKLKKLKIHIQMQQHVSFQIS